MLCTSTASIVGQKTPPRGRCPDGFVECAPMQIIVCGMPKDARTRGFWSTDQKTRPGVIIIWVKSDLWPGKLDSGMESILPRGMLK